MRKFLPYVAGGTAMFLPDAAGGTAIQYCLIATSLSALVMVTAVTLAAVAGLH
jgi:Flp pilus assembly pilin Flp